MTFTQLAGQGSAHLLCLDMTEHPSHNCAVSNLVSVLCHILNFGASLISLCRETQKRPQARKWWGFVLFFFQHAQSHWPFSFAGRRVCKSIKVRLERSLEASGIQPSASTRSPGKATAGRLIKTCPQKKVLHISLTLQSFQVPFLSVTGGNLTLPYQMRTMGF